MKKVTTNIEDRLTKEDYVKGTWGSLLLAKELAEGLRKPQDNWLDELRIDELIRTLETFKGL